MPQHRPPAIQWQHPPMSRCRVPPLDPHALFPTARSVSQHQIMWIIPICPKPT
ncbi:hypothetical protein BC831DRAFT_494614, partial [Entophlyctis helioformis]